MKTTKRSPAQKATKPARKKSVATKDAAHNDAAATTTASAPKKPSLRDPRLPLPGATLEREFKGRTYRLKFLDEGGVEVDGKVFSSLSAAARHVTGAASINGFLWAGLVGRDVQPNNARAIKPTPPASADGHPNHLGTAKGQREALAVAKITKKPRNTK